MPIVALIPSPVRAALRPAPPSRALWNRRLARYRALAARAKEAAESGWFRAANDRHYRDMAGVKTRFGDRESARRSAEAKAVCEAIWRRMDEAEGAYWERCTLPMQKAAVAVVLTPAPDGQAVIAKLRIIRALELDELDMMSRHLLEALLEDVERLAAHQRDERSVLG